MRPLPLVTAAIVGLTTVMAPPAATAWAATTAKTFAGTARVQKFTLYDGSTVEVGPDGMGWRTEPDGRHGRPFSAIGPTASSALGDRPGPDRDQLIKELSVPGHGISAPGTVIVALSSGTVDGAPVPSPKGHALRAAHTTDARVNAALRAVGADTAESLLGALPAARVRALSAAAAGRLGAGAVDLTRVYLVHLATGSADGAARRLRATPGIGYAEPDFYLSTMDSGTVRVPGSVATAASRMLAGAAPGATAGAPAGAATSSAAPSDPALPTNFGLASSFQAYLNSSGVDLSGGYADIVHRFGQLPGQGENITNVSIGDLTDQAMADSGDFYVQYFGPTTVVDNGQRYLDYPALPRIPTYTVDLNGNVNPLGAVEGVDPYLGEVLLDFSVMSPLPHDRQRAGAVGSGLTDLLGIAPGASYRLVEPAQPTFANILTAMAAAAQQTPKPDVITASLGFGTDAYGFPGRYLEDDPVIRSVVAGLVQQDGIVVTISANDGTRLFTPAAVGPDGGSTPTDVPGSGQSATSVADDALSTTPSLVPDSGAIAVGGTTLDDTVAVPPQTGAPLSHTGTFAETRLDGSTNFSSGFGTRVDVSAPSDNIAALNHVCCTSSSVAPVLAGGTSASAPMTAAAAADVLQVARLTGKTMDPAAVRDLLERTGRAVPTQPQVDRDLHVGPQIDVTRAVESLLGGGQTSIVRLSVAHRSPVAGAGADFVEVTDPDNIDLAGPVDWLGDNTGENLLGPVTIGLDVAGVPRNQMVSYVLKVGSTSYTSATPSIRLTPAELLAAAGQPLPATSARTITAVVEVHRGSQVVAQASRTLTFGPTDGSHVMAPAPVVDPVVAPGTPVTVHYDLSGIPATTPSGTVLLSNPELIVSSINHWSPFAAPLYRIAYAAPLTGTTGTVTVPASVFAAGAGVYGVTVLQNRDALMAGAVASFRVDGGGPASRPDAPAIAATGGTAGHGATVTRAAPTFQLNWDAGTVSGATGAMLEVSAPGPTVYGLYNTFTNQFGDRKDGNGVDSGSTYVGALPAVSGTGTFDPAALGLPSSLRYSVRVFATAGGAPVGQASPSSSLEYDDGLAPGGATVDDFDINPGGLAAVSTTSTDTFGQISGTSLYRYTTGTGMYGPSYAQDSSGTGQYFLYGSDPGNHRLLGVEYPLSGSTQHLLTFDTTTGQRVADVPVDVWADDNIWAGRVDPQRHRAALLAWRGSDGADVVLPVDTATGTPLTPVVADNGSSPRSYNLLDIDVSTGDIDVAGSMTGDLCVIRPSGYTTVNLDTGHAAPNKTVASCLTGIASDQAGHVEATVGPLYSYPMLPAAELQEIKERAGTSTTPRMLGPRSPIFPVVDPVHGLLVVGFLAGADYHVNNNAMSEVGVYDLKTGTQVSLDERFNLLQTAFAGPATNMGVLTSERGIQLDPATRTAWTFGPGGGQVQQFSY